MNCQIIHDSIHVRPGWTMEHALDLSRAAVGYGIGGCRRVLDEFRTRCTSSYPSDLVATVDMSEPSVIRQVCLDGRPLMKVRFAGC